MARSGQLKEPWVGSTTAQLEQEAVRSDPGRGHRLEVLVVEPGDSLSDVEEVLSRNRGPRFGARGADSAEQRHGKPHDGRQRHCERDNERDAPTVHWPLRRSQAFPDWVDALPEPVALGPQGSARVAVRPTRRRKGSDARDRAPLNHPGAHEGRGDGDQVIESRRDGHKTAEFEYAG